ncbi:hypothetical protein MKZ24_17975 [Paenibacillus sp. FSL R7-0297]|uniref:hypothetical protein n=1 Tax=unclassified Paenibacillus TaxID=185978 RepID=UPI0004F82F28|nr:hypothetical protein [Paenibacillus sp. FSL R5-0912]AIQ42189.1 hypothetical protein R50912_20675 [Paenibacillus sp. FSL R5-0912]
MERMITHQGKRPAEIMATIGTSILMLCWIWFMLQANKSTRLELIMAFLVIGVAVTIIGILIYRLLTFSRAFVIEIKPEVLQIKNTEIEAGKVKKIFIKGYFKPVIAVKPKANLLVPYKYCFCFADKEDQGIKDLKDWAEQHQIKVLHKRFTRWL